MTLATQLPALDSATEAALRASIRKFGVVVPVLKDQHGQLLDGHHRTRIAQEEGKESPPEHFVEIGEGDDVGQLLVDLNDARRPQLTADQRREMVVALREEGHSYRAIGAALGVHPKTAWKDTNRSTVVMATVELPERITGLDGKSRPAKRVGHRNNPMVRFEAVTERQKQVANGQKQRLVDGLSEVTGLCRGLEALDFGMIAAACSEGEIVMWAKKSRNLSRALYSISTKLSEVEGGS